MISIADSRNNAEIVLWQGKFPFEHDGNRKLHYLNIVLKGAENKELVALANNTAKELEERYGIKQAFPFSLHVTIGKIIEQDDKEDGINAIKQQNLSRSKISNMRLIKAIHSFVLRAHDGSFKNFNLNKN